MGAKEGIADGFRGRPDVDLSAYAASRGLAHLGSATQVDYIGAQLDEPRRSVAALAEGRGLLPRASR